MLQTQNLLRACLAAGLLACLLASPAGARGPSGKLQFRFENTPAGGRAVLSLQPGTDRTWRLVSLTSPADGGLPHPEIVLTNQMLMVEDKGSKGGDIEMELNLTCPEPCHYVQGVVELPPQASLVVGTKQVVQRIRESGGWDFVLRR